MGKAITTKFLPANNKRGSRIKATDGDNSVIVAYEHALHHSERHAYAAYSLAKKMGAKWGWHGFYVAGSTKTGEVFVNVAKDGRFPQAAGMADHGRAGHDLPYGIEGADWFYIPNPDAPFSAAETTWERLDK
jgi:hypothetical protein